MALNLAELSTEWRFTNWADYRMIFILTELQYLRNNFYHAWNVFTVTFTLT